MEITQKSNKIISQSIKRTYGNEILWEVGHLLIYDPKWFVCYRCETRMYTNKSYNSFAVYINNEINSSELII